MSYLYYNSEMEDNSHHYKPHTTCLDENTLYIQFICWANLQLDDVNQSNENGSQIVAGGVT